MLKLRLISVPFVLTAMLSVALLGMPGCGGEESASNKGQSELGDVQKELGDAWEALKDYTYEQSEQLLGAAGKQIDAIEQDIDKTMASAREQSDVTEAQLKEYEDKLDQHVATVREELASLKNASAEEWDDAKSGLQKALDELQQAYRDAKQAMTES